MGVNPERAFSLLQKIGFERVSGTEQERRAARILMDEAAGFGVEARLEPFEVEDGEISLAELEVLEPYQKKYTVAGYKRSLNTPPEGVTADFLYVEDALEANLENARGKVVLLNGRPVYDVYKRLVAAGVAAVITWNGSVYDHPEDFDLGICKLRPPLTEPFGFLTAVNVAPWDALELVRRGASKARVTVIGENTKVTSNNVLAEIPGTEKPDEIVLFCAHYDSVPFSSGVYDNGAGSVLIMELMRHFAANPPKRTLRFAWFGSEEQGLLGSWHYVKAHAEELKNIALVFNSDVGGPILGSNNIKVTGGKEAVAYVDGLMKQAGYAVQVSQYIQSSDSIPFADNGVPSVNVIRAAAPGAGEMHSRQDRISIISAEGLGKLLYPALELADRLVNSHVFPIERAIPPEVKEMVDHYLHRDEKR